MLVLSHVSRAMHLYGSSACRLEWTQNYFDFFGYICLVRNIISPIYCHYLGDILQIKLNSEVFVATDNSSKCIPLRKNDIVLVAAGLQLVLRYLGRVDWWEFIFSLDTCLGSWEVLGVYFFRLRLVTKCAWGHVKSESLDSRIFCQFSSVCQLFLP